MDSAASKFARLSGPSGTGDCAAATSSDVVAVAAQDFFAVLPAYTKPFVQKFETHWPGEVYTITQDPNERNIKSSGGVLQTLLRSKSHAKLSIEAQTANSCIYSKCGTVSNAF